MTVKINQIVEDPRILAGQASAPATGSGKGSFYAKDIGAGQTEAYFVDESGNDIQLTDGGVLAISGSSLGDLGDVSGAAPSLNDVLTWNGSSWAPAVAPGAGGGEVNTGSNLGGAQDADVFKSKVGVDLQFRRLIAGTNMTITENADNITFDATGGAGETNTGSNLGGASDADVFKSKVGVDLQFRRLTAGANVTITENANDIEIASTGGGGLGYEAVITLPPGATIAARVAAAGGNPIAPGIFVYDGLDPAVDPALAAAPLLVTDMVIDHGAASGSGMPFQVSHFNTRAFPVQHSRVDSSAPLGGQILSNIPKTQFAITKFDIDTPTSDPVEIYFKVV